MPYLRNSKNEKIQTDTEKANIFTELLKKIYSTDTEMEALATDTGDDQEIEDHHDYIQDSVEQHIDNLTFHTHTDITRLNNIQFPPLSLEEVKKLIRVLKQRSPGPTGISRTYLTR